MWFCETEVCEAMNKGKMKAGIKSADRRLHIDDANMHNKVCLMTSDDRSGDERSIELGPCDMQ